MVGSWLKRREIYANHFNNISPTNIGVYRLPDSDGTHPYQLVVQKRHRGRAHDRSADLAPEHARVSYWDLFQMIFYCAELDEHKRIRSFEVECDE